MPEGSEQLSFYGYGPGSSYVDMHHHSKKGIYNSTVTKQYTNYIFPQETGNHYDTKWAVCSDFEGCGLRFDALSSSGGKDSFEFSALHYTAADFDKAAMDKDLVPRKETVIHIDYKQTGIGSNSCGPALLKKYSFDDKEFSYAFRITPVFTEVKY